jgi:hypothetical protein
VSALLGRRRLVATIICVLVAVVATESFVLAAVVRQGTVEYMKVATETLPDANSSTSWTDVTSTALALPIPSGEHDFFQIAFSADSPSCTRVNTAANYATCYIRALVDGQPVEPGSVQVGYAFNASAHLPVTMQWASGVYAPGPHYVKIQSSESSPDNQTLFYGRTLTVIRVRAY